MEYMDSIMSARVFMGKSCNGEYVCTSCGMPHQARKLIRKSLKSSFVNFDEIMIVASDYLCESCEELLNDPNMRYKAAYYVEPGKKIIPEREDILRIIQYPADKWVLSLPYSNKKHHWLYAGLSDKHRGYIGTDTRTVLIDYEKYDVEKIVETVEIYSEDAKPFSTKITKRKEGADYLYLHARQTPRTGSGRDRCDSIYGVVCSSVRFLASSADKKELERICRRVKNIGGLRKMGYGEVRDIKIEECPETEWQNCIISGCRAARNIPAEMVEAPRTKRIITRPPYWVSSLMQLGVSEGDYAILRKEVELSAYKRNK